MCYFYSPIGTLFFFEICPDFCQVNDDSNAIFLWYQVCNNKSD